MATMEIKGKYEERNENGRFLSRNEKGVANCAMSIERERLSIMPHVTKVVWMVITDSPYSGRLLASEYNETTVAAASSEDNRRMRGLAMRRTVLTTSSRGVQTRPKRSPTTGDFGEGILDWLLLGESDVTIVSGGLSFGATGALRTARPVYNAIGGCTEMSMIKPPGGTLKHNKLSKISGIF